MAHKPHHTVSLVLQGTNETLTGYINMTYLKDTSVEKPYDEIGAAYYVIAVVLVYGLSMVLLIGSLAKKNMKHVAAESDDRQVNRYLEKVPSLKELSARQQFKELKSNIITLVSSRTPVDDLTRLNNSSYSDENSAVKKVSFSPVQGHKNNRPHIYVGSKEYIPLNRSGSESSPLMAFTPDASPRSGYYLTSEDSDAYILDSDSDSEFINFHPEIKYTSSWGETRVYSKPFRSPSSLKRKVVMNEGDDKNQMKNESGSDIKANNYKTSIDNDNTVCFTSLNDHKTKDYNNPQECNIAVVHETGQPKRTPVITNVYYRPDKTPTKPKTVKHNKPSDNNPLKLHGTIVQQNLESVSVNMEPQPRGATQTKLVTTSNTSQYSSQSEHMLNSDYNNRHLNSLGQSCSEQFSPPNSNDYASTEGNYRAGEVMTAQQVNTTATTPNKLADISAAAADKVSHNASDKFSQVTSSADVHPGSSIRGTAANLERPGPTKADKTYEPESDDDVFQFDASEEYRGYYGGNIASTFQTYVTHENTSRASNTQKENRTEIAHVVPIQLKPAYDLIQSRTLPSHDPKKNTIKYFDYDHEVLTNNLTETAKQNIQNWTAGNAAYSSSTQRHAASHHSHSHAPLRRQDAVSMTPYALNNTTPGQFKGRSGHTNLYTKQQQSGFQRQSHTTSSNVHPGIIPQQREGESGHRENSDKSFPQLRKQHCVSSVEIRELATLEAVTGNVQQSSNYCQYCNNKDGLPALCATNPLSKSQDTMHICPL